MIYGAKAFWRIFTKLQYETCGGGGVKLDCPMYSKQKKLEGVYSGN